MADHAIPHFHNDPGVPVVKIGVKEFMCMGAKPPFDHPHIFIDMGARRRGDLLLLLDALRLRRLARRSIPRPPNANGEAQPEPMRRALIAGAGIAGLSAALALGEGRLRGDPVRARRRPGGIRRRPAALAELRRGCWPARRAGCASLALATAPQSVRILRGRDDAELSALELDERRAPLGRALSRHPPRRPAARARGALRAQRRVEFRLGAGARRLRARARIAWRRPQARPASRCRRRATC